MIEWRNNCLFLEKMPQIPKKLLSALLALAMTTGLHPAFGAASVNDRPSTEESFFEKSEEGWFWYKDTRPPEEQEQEPEQQPADPNSPAPKGPPAFSVAWLKENLPRYLNLAIDEPTPENVRAFLLIQRVMLDKSENFARAVQEQVIGDALVDEGVRRGLSTLASHELDQKAMDGRTDLLKLLSEKIGIFFFFSKDCQLCQAQFPILETFQRRNDIAVYGIATDGSNPGDVGIAWRPDAGLADRLGITEMPTLILVTPSGDSTQIAQGLLSLTELEQRTVIASKRKGWLTEEEFNRGRPLNNPMKNNLADALTAKTPKAKEVVKSYQSSDGFIEPKKLIPLITVRAKVTNTQMGIEKAVPKASKEAEKLKKIANGEE